MTIEKIDELKEVINKDYITSKEVSFKEEEEVEVKFTLTEQKNYYEAYITADSEDLYAAESLLKEFYEKFACEDSKENSKNKVNTVEFDYSEAQWVETRFKLNPNAL